MSEGPDQGNPAKQGDERKKFRVPLLPHTPIRRAEDDYLNFPPMAQSVAVVILDPETVTPLTVAISAPWGAGKTSLANLIIEQLPTTCVGFDVPRPLVIWFNAWLHTDAPNLGAAFGASVARALDANRSWWRRVRAPLASSMLTPWHRRRRRLAFLASVAVTAIGLSAWLGNLLPGSSDDVTASVQERWGAFAASVFVLGAGATFLWSRVVSATRSMADYFADPSAEATRGTVGEVRKQLAQLVKDARFSSGERNQPRRIVVFVDDLERTTPPRAVDVCEVSSQLLDAEGVVTFLVADMPAVAAAAEATYGEGAGKYRPRDGLARSGTGEGPSYGRLFLEKLVQFQIDLPPTTAERTRRVARGRLAPVRQEAHTRQGRVRSFVRLFNPSIAWRVSGGTDDVIDAQEPREAVGGQSSTVGRWLAAQLIAIAAGYYALGTALLLLLLLIPVVGAWILEAEEWVVLTVLIAILVPTIVLVLAYVLMAIRAVRNAWGRPLGEFWRASAYALGAAILAGWLFSEATRADSWRWLRWIGFAFVGLFALAFFFVAVNDARNRMRNKRRAAALGRAIERVRTEAYATITRTVNGNAGGTAIDVQRISADIRDRVIGTDEVQRARLSPAVLNVVVQGVVNEFVGRDSLMRREAEEEIAAFLRRIPRSAIRLSNRLRFNLSVASTNALFNSGVTPGQVGKWALLSERWPELAWQIALEPQTLSKLETASRSKKGFRTAIQKLVVCRSIDDPGSEQAGAARRFLATDSDHITKSATDH